MDVIMPESRKGQIILASASPRRAELLRRSGLKAFAVAPSGVDEAVPAGIPPREAVMFISERKAAAVMSGPDDIVIAADTVVWLDGAILGKPKDKAEAFKMLSGLAGERHTVYTGLTVRRGAAVRTGCEKTHVFFRKLDEDEIRAYIATGEPMDKAGAYGVQGAACSFVERIEGDYYNVMGLPMARLSKMLKEFGIRLLTGECIEKD